MTSLAVSLLFSLFLLSSLLLSTSGNVVNLEQVSPSGHVCPGEDLMYQCSGCPLEISSLILVWQEIDHDNKPSSVTITAFASSLGGTSVGHFVTGNTTSSSTIVISSVVLKEALLSHNNITIRCSNNVNSTIDGYQQQNKKVSVAGASTPPLKPELIPWNVTTVQLKWSLPPNEPNCSFSYIVRVRNSSSVLHAAYYNINLTTSLVISDLSAGVNYDFAVAVEDAQSNNGPWSGTANILWSVPLTIQNLMLQLSSLGSIEVDWISPAGNDSDIRPHVLYYEVSHNITESGSVKKTLTNDTTITLNGASPGNTYCVHVAAVNIVGTGELTSKTVYVFTTISTDQTLQHFTTLFDTSVIITAPLTMYTSNELSASSSSASYSTAYQLHETSSPAPTEVTSIPVTLIIAPVVAVIVTGAALLLLIVGLIWCRAKASKIHERNVPASISLENLGEKDASGNIYNITSTNSKENMRQSSAQSPGITYADLSYSSEARSRPAAPPPAFNQVIYSDLQQQKSERIQPPVEAGPKTLIYADISTSLANRPTPPPSAHNNVVYSDVQQLNLVPQCKTHGIIYADLGNPDGQNRKAAAAVPPPADDKVLYADIATRVNSSTVHCIAGSNI